MVCHFGYAWNNRFCPVLTRFVTMSYVSWTRIMLCVLLYFALRRFSFNLTWISNFNLCVVAVNVYIYIYIICAFIFCIWNSIPPWEKLCGSCCCGFSVDEEKEEEEKIIKISKYIRVFHSYQPRVDTTPTLTFCDFTFMISLAWNFHQVAPYRCHIIVSLWSTIIREYYINQWLITICLQQQHLQMVPSNSW